MYVEVVECDIHTCTYYRCTYVIDFDVLANVYMCVCVCVCARTRVCAKKYL